MNDDLRSTYDILEQIGKGSGGVVYKAYHKRLRKTVVLKKVIGPEGKDLRNRQEVDILKNVNHSYLPQVLDFLETDQGVFTVMNYIPGKSFQQLLKEGARFSKEDLLRWALQICSALNYLHTREIPIIHGDIKPSNIMLKPDGDICLIDFNISFFLNENTVLGCTRGYTSPEQFWAVSSKKRQENIRFVIDNKADIYSVGATLYHMATGNVRADYTHELDIEKLARVVGPRFAAVIAKATDLDPNNRYESAAEMYKALKAVPEEGRKELKEERKSRGKAIGIVAIAVLIMAAAAGGFIAYGKHQQKEYNQLVSGAKTDILAGSYDQAGQKCSDALDIYDDKAEAYYWQDYILYCKGDLAGCASMAEDQIKNKVKESAEESGSRAEHKSLADLYCLRGTCLLEDNRTDEALQVFREVHDSYSSLMRGDNYRDYAVALARGGQIKEAEEMIKTGKADTEDPMPEYSIAFTEGEIYRMDNRDEDAKACFRKVINALGDADLSTDVDKELIMYRSYMETARIYEDRNDFGEAISVLEEAREKLSASRQDAIERKMASDYDEMGRYGQAAELYRTVAERDPKDFDDWYNYAIEELKIGDAAKTAGEARTAADNASYGAEKYREVNGSEDFRCWAILAYAEAIKQKFSSDPDYDYFETCYRQASTMYSSDPDRGRYETMMTNLNRMNEEVQKNKYR